jgi:hypothetical protein
MLRPFIDGLSKTLGVAQPRRYVPTPEEEMKAVVAGLEWAGRVALGERSPHCMMCSACHPLQPCNPACHICWPDRRHDMIGLENIWLPMWLSRKRATPKEEAPKDDVVTQINALLRATAFGQNVEQVLDDMMNRPGNWMISHYSALNVDTGVEILITHRSGWKCP